MEPRLSVTLHKALASRVLLLAVITAGVAEVAAQLLQVYRYSYDAYTHMFFADHYRRDWFNLWEPRWYGGFSVTAYPPLTHELIALLSLLSNIEVAYQTLAVAASISLTYSVYLYSRIFLHQREAEFAALIASLLPATGTVLNGFGQLPTVLSTSLALTAMYKFNEYLAKGSMRNLAQSSLLTASSAFAHHFTFLFFVPATQIIIFIRHLRGRVSTTILRTFIHISIVSALTILVLCPFILFMIAPRPWAEIPHGSRQNLFTNPLFSVMFFWGMYSFTILLLPNAIAIALKRKELLPPLSLFLAMLVLGLGGTTPLPSILLGNLWQILTYDKFAYWATVTYTPLLAITLVVTDVFDKKHHDEGNAPSYRKKRLILMSAFIVGLAVSHALSSGGVILMGLQPLQLLGDDQLDRVAHFLDSNSDWRYITLGFGNQLVPLSMKTVAPTLDGGYNLAKTYPLLVESGVENIDAAKHFPNGIKLLETVLSQEANNGLRFIASADEYYDQILRDFGLVPVREISGERKVMIWEIPYARVAPDSRSRVDKPATAYIWGIVPPMTLVILIALTLHARLANHTGREDVYHDDE